MAAVSEPRGTRLGVTLGHRAAPFDAVACTGGDLFRSVPLGEAPDQLPGAARDRLLGRTIAALQIVSREMGLYRKSFGHAPIIH